MRRLLASGPPRSIVLGAAMPFSRINVPPTRIVSPSTIWRTLCSDSALAASGATTSVDRMNGRRRMRKAYPASGLLAMLAKFKAGAGTTQVAGATAPLILYRVAMLADAVPSSLTSDTNQSCVGRLHSRGSTCQRLCRLAGWTARSRCSSLTMRSPSGSAASRCR
jgi:hypothetical protein